MTIYRFQILNGGIEIAEQTSDCRNDAAAILAATLRMDLAPPHYTVVVWQEGRYVWFETTKSLVA